MNSKGYFQIYTGNGKGKTTAALGLSMRAVCAGKRVFFGQFIKGMAYSELKLPEQIEAFELKQFGRDCFIFNDPTQEDIDLAQAGLAACAAILKSGDYDVVVLDEINIALYYKLFTEEAALEAIAGRAPHVEVIATGRYAPPALIEAADLVTEMREVKHYYRAGVPARRGIEN